MTAERLPDPYDVRLATRATGLLAAFNAGGVLSAADVHVALRLGRLGSEQDERVLLAAALAVRAVRLGSVCTELARVRETAAVDGDDAIDPTLLDWPDEQGWAAACAASTLVALGVAGDSRRPLRLVDGLLYLDRYWRQEQEVRAGLDVRVGLPVPVVDLVRLRAALARLFPGPVPDHQRLAAAACATGWVTVLAGGPGTGKTTTVARLLALLHDQPGPPPRVALAAPTGKAAARLQEAVSAEAATLSLADQQRLGNVTASTLHRLLGWRPDSRSRFRHDRTNRLPYDVVVVDETSMVSLTLMSRLVEALRSDARLLLVGDPDQLASVEAGAVLGDLVARPESGPDRRGEALAEVVGADLRAHGPLTNGVVRLTKNWRFGGAISGLAAAVQRGDADEAMAILRSGSPDVHLIEIDSLEGRTPRALDAVRDDVVAAGRDLTDAARSGAVDDALRLLERHRLLCAHRQGPYGVERWSEQIEAWLADAIEGYAEEGEWYRGRPLLVTTNDYELKLFNGDTGVVVDVAERGPLAAFLRGSGQVLVAPSRLSSVQTVHAMTIHRGQGSQFDRVSLILPPADSPLLTRELLYTALTRAKAQVRVVASEAALRAAMGRPVVRASGLRRRFGA